MASTDPRAHSAARRRALAQTRRHALAVAARYDGRSGRLVIELDTGLTLSFQPVQLAELAGAEATQLRGIEISPSGMGLYFPALDLDLYLPTLLEHFMGSRKWMAAQLGKAGGQSVTEAKQEASRRNGRLGGRPRKVATTA